MLQEQALPALFWWPEGLQAGVVGPGPGFLCCSGCVPDAGSEHVGKCVTLVKGAVTQLHQVTGAELNPLYLALDPDPVHMI